MLLARGKPGVLDFLLQFVSWSFIVYLGVSDNIGLVVFLWNFHLRMVVKRLYWLLFCFSQKIKKANEVGVILQNSIPSC